MVHVFITHSENSENFQRKIICVKRSSLPNFLLLTFPLTRFLYICAMVRGFLSIHSFNRPQQQQQQQQRRVLRLARKPINRASNFDLRSHGRHPLVRHPGGVTLPTGTTLRGISYVTWPWSPAASALEMLSSSSFAAASSLNAARTRKDKGTAEAMFEYIGAASNIGPKIDLFKTEK